MSLTLNTSPPQGREEDSQGNIRKQPTAQSFQNQSGNQTLQDFPKQLKLEGLNCGSTAQNSRGRKGAYLSDGLIWEEGVGGGGASQDIQHQRVVGISHHPCRESHGEQHKDPQGPPHPEERVATCSTPWTFSPFQLAEKQSISSTNLLGTIPKSTTKLFWRISFYFCLKSREIC